MDRDLADLRREYRARGLSESDAGDDPLRLFRAWLDDAIEAGLPEPNAMVLATATPDGRPAARAVLLKSLDDGAFVFFTHQASRKGRELAANPCAALCFVWLELERQIRVEGRVEGVPEAAADAYFTRRPRASQLGAWASAQSETVPSRDELERALEAASARFAGREVSRPPGWRGYRLRPEVLEFWQGRPSRLHDRLLFTRRAEGGWDRVRLAP
ncbi:MAG: pyridoxamine 5'-phosphate oxidase [Acidobacteria bacterium]|jgi:pyridoxamine 5'-phosphate oxidase|nr:pyridoxamine 5'-phosphate oxidase [Acidobacteriota bacterium]